MPPYFGSTLTDLGRNITDRQLAQTADEQALRQYLAQIAATQAQERNVGTQAQASQNIAQVQTEAQKAHYQSIERLNSERNELLKQQAEATTDTERMRIQAQLDMADSQREFLRQQIAATLMAGGGAGGASVPPAVAAANAKAMIEDQARRNQIATLGDRLNERLAAVAEEAAGRGGLARWWSNDKEVILKKASEILRDMDPSGSFRFDPGDGTNPNNKGKFVPRQGVLDPTAIPTAGQASSPEAIARALEVLGFNPQAMGGQTQGAGSPGVVPTSGMPMLSYDMNPFQQWMASQNNPYPGFGVMHNAAMGATVGQMAGSPVAPGRLSDPYAYDPAAAMNRLMANPFNPGAGAQRIGGTTITPMDPMAPLPAGVRMMEPQRITPDIMIPNIYPQGNYVR
jgi:hypothetical protein